jgi:hypothetical protein
MRNLRLKWVGRRDEIQHHFRLFRVMWEVGVPGQPGGGHSNMLSVALQPKLFQWGEGHSFRGWFLVILGVRLHRKRSYGGIFA